MKIEDIVSLSVDLPEYGLVRGKHGFIVAIYDDPGACCKAEFLDSAGNTHAQIVLGAEQFTILWSG